MNLNLYQVIFHLTPRFLLVFFFFDKLFDLQVSKVFFFTIVLEMIVDFLN